MNSENSIFSIRRNKNIRHLISSHDDSSASATVSISLAGNNVAVSAGWQTGLQVLIKVRALVVESNEA